ncbi:PREDICTED: D-glucuronyl C5-epimerase [Rhagoletis zephyria]|uniref:D-glucuronyl C5-epimerase n=1 Tax=Rhagoletis zephyria TaxID=28612 RepID=UPI00081169DB|nr:PREDICTED: D-glucuronyl C5-epimerase [Rhagoletis zephyria]
MFTNYTNAGTAAKGPTPTVTCVDTKSCNSINKIITTVNTAKHSINHRGGSINRFIVKRSSTSGTEHKSRKFNAKREQLFFLIIMRLNLKNFLYALIAFVVFTGAVLYFFFPDFLFPHNFVQHWDRRLKKGNSLGSNTIDDNQSLLSTPLQNIECWINQEYSIPCKHSAENNEVYVPFSFLRSYFDINGGMLAVTSSSINDKSVNGDDNIVPRFAWVHSNAKINVPKGKYDSRGRFAYFENYNVEVRDRVKCISAAEGVPISTQWEKSGYFYPTQIAQFALAHYSKNLSEPPPKIKVLEDADTNKSNWYTPKSSNISRIWHPKFNTSVIQYETAIGYDSAVRLDINQTLELVLSVDILLVTNSSSLMVTLQSRETKQNYLLHYIPADLRLSTQDQNIYYGMGTSAVNRWRHITRDLFIDVQKGVMSGSDKKSPLKIRRNELRVTSVAFLGVGFFDNITFSTYDHLAHFYDAAEWFIHNQDLKTGGWPNPVRRSLNGFTELKAGWLSAMGQGHAISVLARAYFHSGGDKRYLKAAALGLKPFRVYSKDGGVLAQFMDKYFWYEEYPTTPPSFVLNGFIYSLLGLFDLNSTAPSNIGREAGKLFNQGMYSLKKMLLLYDTGSGTSYDLRHLSLGTAPNLARDDYHATHVSQLLLLSTIDSDPLLMETAERWKGYMFGKRAKHN